MNMSLTSLTLLLNKNEKPILFISLFLSLLLASTLYLYNKIIKGQKSKLPPFPPRLPIIGNLHQLGKVPYHSFRALSKKYGPIFSLKLGQVPALVISSPDIVGEIVKSHDAIFASRPKTLGTEIVFNEGNGIIFAPYGDQWKETRRVCVVELLSLKRVHSFQGVREHEVGELVDRIRRGCVKNNGCEAINLSEMLTEASTNIISRCLFGHSYEDEDGLVKRLGEVVKATGALLSSFSAGDFFPCLRWIDEVSGLVGRFRSVSREYQAILDRVIEEHKSSSRSRSDSAEDFVDVLLRIHQDSNSDDSKITQNKLLAIIQDMFAAGFDTSFALGEWTMAELIRSPRVMKKTQEEVRNIAAKKGKIEMNDIDQMIYLKNVVKETLRLHPPTPLLIPSETTANAQIGPYEIPAKTRIFVNVWAIQRDPSLWDDPEDFVPERFENNTLNFYQSQDFRYIPFGYGKRKCPGIAFGVLNVEYLIANLLYWYDWENPKDGGSVESIDMSEIAGMGIHKKIPLHVVPVLVHPKNV